VVVDREGKYLLYNAALRRMVGSQRTETLPAAWDSSLQVFHSDGETPYAPEEVPLARALRGESVDEVDLLVRSESAPGGIWLRVTSRPLRDAAGALSGAVSVVNDITEQKLLRDALRLGKEKLERRVSRRVKELVVVNDALMHEAQERRRAEDAYRQLFEMN